MLVSSSLSITLTSASHKPKLLPCLHLNPQTMSSSQVQSAVHPKATSSYAELDSTNHSNGKRFLTTWTDVKQEWQTGSRKRVIGQFVASTLVGFLLGWII